MLKTIWFLQLIFVLTTALLRGPLFCSNISAETLEQLESKHHVFQIQNFADIPGIPWGMAFLPDGRLLVTERKGRLRIVDQTGKTSEPIKGMPAVRAEGQGGLLDVALHPNYQENAWIYLSYSQALSDGNSFTTIARGKIVANSFQSLELIYRAPIKDFSQHNQHYGSRILFDQNNYMFFSIGDRGQRPEAQNLNTANGKIHRLLDDGTVPPDNPYLGQENALPSIWSWGHRNPQGLALDPKTGLLWSTEHGPRGGDELNLIKRGENFGWPIVTYGINYNGSIISEETHAEGMMQPNHFWIPSIGVCGIDFYDNIRFPKWENHLLVSSLRFGRLYRLHINKGVVLEEEILMELGRTRDIETGPDGLIYVALENPGRIVRLIPAD
ncbi:MAG: PQQ-dependent sugar dehydrogenase [Candidatus Latescibacterota bacterium]|nr:PQQ-dependent sugar dehydrogenase [Candidatus Latescibacterota bacterium]